MAPLCHGAGRKGQKPHCEKGYKTIEKQIGNNRRTAGTSGAHTAEGAATSAWPTQEQHGVCGSYIGKAAVNN